MIGKPYCVYKHTTPSGKVYIGVTCKSPDRRWENGHGYKYNKHFWNAIVKYGWDNISHEIVCNGLTETQAFSLERELIALTHSTDPKFGYNITSGGRGGLSGLKDSDETRRKKSESAKRAWDKRGRSEAPRPMKHGQKKLRVEQWDKQGVWIKTWVSMCEIERQLGIPTGKISECCHGKRSSYGGFIWKLTGV